MNRFISLSFVLFSSLALAQSVDKPSVNDIKLVFEAVDRTIDNQSMQDELCALYQNYCACQTEMLQRCSKQLSAKEKEIYLWSIAAGETMVLSIQNLANVVKHKQFTLFEDMFADTDCLPILGSLQEVLQMDTPEELKRFEEFEKITAKISVIQDQLSDVSVAEGVAKTFDLFCDSMIVELNKSNTCAFHSRLITFFELFKQNFPNVLENYLAATGATRQMIISFFGQQIAAKAGLLSYDFDSEDFEDLKPYAFKWLQKQINKPIVQELCNVALYNAAETRAILA